jgi:hypothetical protein
MGAAFRLGDDGGNIGDAILSDNPGGESRPDDALVHEKMWPRSRAAVGVTGAQADVKWLASSKREKPGPSELKLKN